MSPWLELINIYFYLNYLVFISYAFGCMMYFLRLSINFINSLMVIMGHVKRIHWWVHVVHKVLQYSIAFFSAVSPKAYNVSATVNDIHCNSIYPLDSLTSVTLASQRIHTCNNFLWTPDMELVFKLLHRSIPSD